MQPFEDELPYHAHSATLRVYGDLGDPSRITWATEVQPSRSFCRGDLRPRRLPPHHTGWQGRTPAPYDFWAWQSSADEDEPLDVHLTELLDTFEHRLDVLRTTVPQARIDVFVGYRTNVYDGGFDLGPAVLARLGRLDLHVAFSVILA